MNNENIKYCIELMKDAHNLNMEYWQDPIEFTGICKSIDELHKCGNTACFAGYVAISEKFNNDGGRPSANGSPLYYKDVEYYVLDDAIAEWLDIPRSLACSLTLYSEGFYPVPFSQVKPKHVIEKLQMILKGELQ